jgi:hypothetical protein
MTPVTSAIPCTLVTPSWTAEASTWSSLAFVVAGLWILGRGPRRREVLALGVLAVLIGVGSMVQHGPAPPWNPVLHDPPLLGAYALVAADAAADLAGRRARTWWWLAPTLADGALAAVSPEASIVAQGLVSAVAIVLVAVRALARPAVRRRIVAALFLLAVGTLAGELARTDRPWCPADWFDVAPSDGRGGAAPTTKPRDGAVHSPPAANDPHVLQ